MTASAAPAANPARTKQKKYLIPTETRLIQFHEIFIDDIDHGGRRTSMIGRPPYLRHGMDHHENCNQALDNSQELILPIGEHVPRKKRGV